MASSNIVIPPNGYIGANSQSPAVQNQIRRALSGSRAAPRASGAKRRRKTRKPKKAAAGKRRTTKRATKKKALVKGSSAAKAWGRKMKALRKKRG